MTVADKMKALRTSVWAVEGIEERLPYLDDSDRQHIVAKINEQLGQPQQIREFKRRGGRQKQAAPQLDLGKRTTELAPVGVRDDEEELS